MKTLYDVFETDQEYVDLDYGEAGVIRVRQAGVSNTLFVKTFETLSRPYRRQIEMETLDRKTSDKILAEAFARAVVVGWEGVRDRNGEEMPFSVENCVSLFMDLPELFRDVREQSMRFTNFVTKNIEEDAGN